MACKGSEIGRSSSNAKQKCSSERVSDPQQKQRNQSGRCHEKGLYNTISTENLRGPQTKYTDPKKKCIKTSENLSASRSKNLKQKNAIYSTKLFREIVTVLS